MKNFWEGFTKQAAKIKEPMNMTKSPGDLKPMRQGPNKPNGQHQPMDLSKLSMDTMKTMGALRWAQKIKAKRLLSAAQKAAKGSSTTKFTKNLVRPVQKTQDLKRF